MSTPTVEPQQQQPPPMAMTQQAYTTHSGHGSIGPVIAVLAVITVLGVIACVIGRLGSGRRIMGHGQYDFEGWLEKKCASCLDGRVDPPVLRATPPENTDGGGGDAVPVAVPMETPPKTEEETTQHNTQASHQTDES